MTKKQVWRYFCEFCGKGSLSGGHMRAHEKHCTANPNRICRMHKYFDVPQCPMEDLIEALAQNPNDHGLADLRKLAGGCPICILAAIRQSGICKWDGDPTNPPVDLSFNFKFELAEAWKAINDAAAEDYHACGYYDH